MESPLKKVDCFVYDPTKHIGKGSFATVYVANHEKTNAPVALKVIPAAKLIQDEEHLALFMREIEVLRQIKGEHIVRLLDIKRTTNNLYIITDYCDGGDLEKKIKAKYQFSEEEACSIAKQIADAFITVENLHIVNSDGRQVTIMHRDIKPANILFHQNKVKVADFGFAKMVDDVDKNIKKAHTPWLGTPLYMAPEVLNEEEYSAKCDVWSTGMLFYQLLFGKLPWTGFSIPNLYDNITETPLVFPKEIDSKTKDLISKMLEVKEENRLSWKEVYEHPALKNIDVRAGVLDQSKRMAPRYDISQENAISQRLQSNKAKEDQQTAPSQDGDGGKVEELQNNSNDWLKSPITIALILAVLVMIGTKIFGWK